MRDSLLLTHGPAEDIFRGRFALLGTEAIDTPAAEAAAVFLVHERGSGDARAALQQIRGHRLPAVYLKPVVLLADEAGAPDELTPLADAVWNVDTQDEPPPGITASLERLRQRANSLRVTTPGGDTHIPRHTIPQGTPIRSSSRSWEAGRPTRTWPSCFRRWSRNGSSPGAS